MNAIKAWVRNGRIETEAPVGLPEGTELVLIPASASNKPDDEAWDDTPEGIHNWLEWYDSLQPLIFTAEEREAWQKEMEARKEWELTHADEREQKLRGVWE